MRVFLRIICVVCLLVGAANIVHAQENDGWSSSLDSARAKEDDKKDSVVLTAKYVRYATLAMLKKSTYTVQIDTSHHNYQYYNPQNKPWNPSVNLGSYGLATRDLLFQPTKIIGFQSGFHALERYLLSPDSIQYFRARARFSELSTVGFFFEDQVFRARVSQNIHPRWNVGADFNSTKTDGYYQNQTYGDLKASLSSWYESPSRRYNMIVNGVFNRLTSSENGSVVNDTLFRDENRMSSDRYVTKLYGTGDKRPHTKWIDNSFFLRQSMYIGKMDTIDNGKPTMRILPTNSMAHNSSIRRQSFQFYKNLADEYGAFPYNSSTLTDDTTNITSISNEFEYNFYLRGKSIFKNEARLKAAFQHDMYWYSDSVTNNKFYQNASVKGELGYKFSDRVDFTLKANQIVAGHNFGDFLYEANADISMGDKAGKISLSAYSQNKSPEMIFEHLAFTYDNWDSTFNKTKIQNLTFQYANPKLGFHGKVEYFLMDNYLYFKEIDNPYNDAKKDRVIAPAQLGTANLLKVSVGQKFKYRRFTFDNLVVYQKTDQQDVLATPELYTWHSLYYGNKLYNVMDYNVGFDVKFNTPFKNPNYSINSGQFYNANTQIEFSTYPVIDFWLTANIDRVNMFLSYNFANQGLWPKGYYSVRRYPMNDANFRFGVSWKFYD